MVNVAVVSGEERREIVAQAFTFVLPEVLDKLKAAPSVFIKPNLIHHENQLASTHVDAVRGVLDVLHKHTQAPVTIADASYHGTKAAFRNFGYERLPGEYASVELFDLNDDATVIGWYVKRDGTHGTMGRSKRASEAGFTINLACLKTDQDAGVSLSVQNWVIGTWITAPRDGTHGTCWPRSPFLHEQGPWAHHMTIAELLGQSKPDVSVIDGHTAMEGEGPTRGHAVPACLALSATDAGALDTIACELMNIAPKDIGYLDFASEKGYTLCDRTQIDIIGETDVTRLSHAFQKPKGWDHIARAWREGGNLTLV